jgi:hypothetical protein
MDITDP